MEKLLYKAINAQFEVKQLEDDFIHIEGLASTFGNIDRAGDIIVKGAFTKTLQNPDRKVKLLNQHNMEEVLGVIDQLSEVEEGLFVKARMPRENSKVKDLTPLLKMGALGDFSIGFNIVDADVSPDGNRTIKEIDLWEVSIVTIPANPMAKITSVKKEQEQISVAEAEAVTTKREFEELLVSTGAFTRKACIALSTGFNECGGSQRDSDNAKSGSQRDSDNVDCKQALDELDKLKQLFIEV